MITGIYTITNIVNGKIYVGLSLNIEKRFSEHKEKLNTQTHKNVHLQDTWNKYGEENFLFEVLWECSPDLLSSEEHYWCSVLNTHDRRFGYNIRPTHPYGKVINTIEIRKKMSSSKKGIKLSKESIEKRTATRKERVHTYKKKVKKPVELSTRQLTGIWHSDQTKSKMRKPKTVPFNYSEKRIEHWYSLTKQVLKYDKNLNLLEEFVSISSAARSIGSSQGTLGACCKFNENPSIKKYRTLKGFIWKIK